MRRFLKTMIMKDGEDDCRHCYCYCYCYTFTYTFTYSHSSSSYYYYYNYYYYYYYFDYNHEDDGGEYRPTTAMAGDHPRANMNQMVKKSQSSYLDFKGKALNPNELSGQERTSHRAGVLALELKAQRPRSSPTKKSHSGQSHKPL